MWREMPYSNGSSGRACFCSALPTCNVRTPIDCRCRHRVFTVVPTRLRRCASRETGDSSDLRVVIGIGLHGRALACQCITLHALLRFD